METTPTTPTTPEPPAPPVVPEPPAPPKVPLVISDQRFEMLKRNLERDFQRKFAKLFKRTKDRDARFGTVEFVQFLAVFIFDQLRFADSINEGKGPDSFVVFNTQLFGLQDRLRQLIQEREKLNEPNQPESQPEPKPESGAPGPAGPAPATLP